MRAGFRDLVLEDGKLVLQPGVLFGVVIRLAAQIILQEFQALAARERVHVIALDIGIVGIEFVGLLQRVAGTLVVRGGVVDLRQAEIFAGVHIAIHERLQVGFLGLRKLSLAEIHFAERDDRGRLVRSERDALHRRGVGFSGLFLLQVNARAPGVGRGHVRSGAGARGARGNYRVVRHHGFVELSRAI